MSEPLLVVHTNACTFGWDGCREVYNGVHDCQRGRDHTGRHRCPCGALSSAVSGEAAEPDGSPIGPESTA